MEISSGLLLYCGIYSLYVFCVSDINSARNNRALVLIFFTLEKFSNEIKKNNFCVKRLVLFYLSFTEKRRQKIMRALWPHSVNLQCDLNNLRMMQGKYYEIYVR